MPVRAAQRTTHATGAAVGFNAIVSLSLSGRQSCDAGWEGLWSVLLINAPVGLWVADQGDGLAQSSDRLDTHAATLV